MDTRNKCSLFFIAYFDESLQSYNLWNTIIEYNYLNFQLSYSYVDRSNENRSCNNKNKIRRYI